MRSGEEIVLAALRKEFTRLSKAADRAKAAADEYMNTGTEMLAVYKELQEMIRSKETGKAALKKLAALRDREARVNKINKKDFLKLINKQSSVEIERDSLGNEIQMMEFRQSLCKAG